MINSIDVSYATAVGTEPVNMSAMNMHAMNMGTADNDNNMSHNNNNNHNNSNSIMASMDMDHGSYDSSMAKMSQHTDDNSNAIETSTIAVIAAYQTAKELTNVATELFNSTIKQNIPSNATDNSNTIESSLQQLKDMIESKDPYDKVMGVIHGPIQTNMLETFNLPLKASK